jgi:cell division protein ZapA
MAHVTVTIGGRNYRLACNEGEEPHLESLARELDVKIDEMRVSFGEIGDQRLVVMAALTIVDELTEARRTIAKLEQSVTEIADLDQSAQQETDQQAAMIAQALSEASHRIESLAAALAPPTKG